MRPPKEKWLKTSAALAAVASVTAAVAAEVDLSPRQRDLVVKMQNTVADLLEHVETSEECEMD
jgi:anti-sigma-K factor RskA